MKKSDIIIALNRECFGEDDPFSYEQNLKPYLKNGHYVLMTWYGFNVGYALYDVYENHIECVRRGVKEDVRGKGLGVRLTKILMRRAKALDKNYWTYAHKDNLPSINSSLKAGLKVYRVGREWLELVYYTKKENKDG